MTTYDISMLFQFIGGLGLFLYGMNTMADGLQRSTGSKTKKLMGFLTNNRFMAVIVGALITALIQSSSATTVMVVGFVNAGVLSLVQAVGVIMGANIGTTITAWIVSMNEWGSILKPEFFAPLLVGIGAFLLMFSKKEKQHEIGEILVGFGVLFIGLSFMSDSIKPYRNSAIFVNAFAILGHNPILGVLAGAAVTAVIQSSSASVSILQTLALNGIVNWNSAVFITLGQNIGTCVTAIISSAGAQKNAKRAAMIHLLFNVFGAIIFGIIMFIVFQFQPSWGKSSINTVQISIFHTIFNVSNTIILFPFAKVLVYLSQKLIPDHNEDKEEVNVVTEISGHLDKRLLESPSFAIETAVNQVIRMGHFTLENVETAMEAFIKGDKELTKKVFEREKDINNLQKILTEYLVEVGNLQLTEKQHIVIKNLFYSVNDIERIGDHAENIVELATQKISEDLFFSEEATKDLNEIASNALSAVRIALEAREEMSKEKVAQVLSHEDKVDSLENQIRESHIDRLAKSECTPENGIIYLDVISNIERISDHANNMAGYVLDEIK